MDTEDFRFRARDTWNSFGTLLGHAQAPDRQIDTHTHTCRPHTHAPDTLQNTKQQWAGARVEVSPATSVPARLLGWCDLSCVRWELAVLGSLQ